jgi:hypothetical protein
MMKVEMGAKAAPSTLFEVATDPLHGLTSYSGLAHRHFVEYGMDSVFYFTNPDGNWVNILNSHSQFSREEVSRQTAVLIANQHDSSLLLPSARYDMYDMQNLRFSAAFILASITPHLRAQVITKAGVDYNNGPVVWMYVMGLVQSGSYRGLKVLQSIFEERRLKNEPGENVTKHTLKLRNDYARLRNANMVPHDALMTVVDSFIDCTTNAFAIWAATKRIAVADFLKENAGKASSALVLIKDAPTIEAICDEADDHYQSLVGSKLWVAIDSKKDKDAAPTAFLLEKLSRGLDRLSSNQGRNDNTCYTCGKEGHKSPACPNKEQHKRFKVKDQQTVKPPQRRSQYPEWQRVKPKDGESETITRDSQTFHWCGVCNHWRTTHGTQGHRTTTGGTLPSRRGTSATKRVSFKDQAKTEESGGNLAELVSDENNETSLVFGAWCGEVCEPSTAPYTPYASVPTEALGAWVFVPPKQRKQRTSSTSTLPPTPNIRCKASSSCTRTCFYCAATFSQPSTPANNNRTCFTCYSGLQHASMEVLRNIAKAQHPSDPSLPLSTPDNTVSNEGWTQIDPL